VYSFFVSDAPLLTESVDGVLTLTINRPDFRNAVNLAVTSALGQAIERADHDDDIRVVVLTGAGTEAFCAGADLKAVRRGEPIQPVEEIAAAWGFAGLVRHPISKPLIAAVNGAAVGGGMELVLACDLAIAADTAVFGLPEVRLGVFPAAGGAFRLPAQIPPKVALEMLLTAEPIPARRAYEVGLVNAVVEPAVLHHAAAQLARRVAALPRRGVLAAKRVARGMTDGTIPGESAQWARSEAEWARLSRRA
jgi:crotonobetainyl-CoA hydratase